MANSVFESVTNAVGQGFKAAVNAFNNSGSIGASFSAPSANGWEGLNPHLVAEFFEVEETTAQDGFISFVQKTGAGLRSVFAPLSEADLQLDIAWQSPFENAGAEASFQNTTAMIQSGAWKQVLDLFTDGKEGAVKGASDWLQEGKGRSGFTKLNGRQVFQGIQPMKISATALLRAWNNAYSEVEEPLEQLIEWALPQKLAPDATIARILTNLHNSVDIKAVLPSEVPKIIGMRYKKRVFMPLVIESIGIPLASPINASGDFVQLQVPLTLCSLTALDVPDWKLMTSGSTVLAAAKNAFDRVLSN